MNMKPELYAELDKAWKTTCRILLGEEIGELKEYEDWLREYTPAVEKRKSHISGRDVHVLIDDYDNYARFVSLDEVKEKAVEPLTINEIKDIDSIIEAVAERWEYTGDRVLGNSTNVETSDMVFDSHHVLGSTYIYKSSYIFGASGPRNCKYIFGAIGGNDSEFSVRHFGAVKVKRCLETSYCTDSSDLIFCMHCIGCNDLMFSFNQTNKGHMIGNLPLTKEKYTSLKAKLLEEMRQELKKSKRFISLISAPNELPKTNIRIPVKKEVATTLEPIEKAFSSTFRVLFRKDVRGIEQYEEWLSRHLFVPKGVITIFGNRYYMPQTKELRGFYSAIPIKRMVQQAEASELANLHLDEKDIASLDALKGSVARISYFCLDIQTGNAMNVIKTGAAYDSSNIYKTSVAITSEYAGVNSTVGKDSKYIFGSARIVDSQFCMHCYYSNNLTRCFEMDACTNCSDSMFCHNSEGLQEAMFCWNAKGKRYSIGNTVLPPDRYRVIKGAVIEQLADELLKNKELKWDIYNIGCYK